MFPCNSSFCIERYLISSLMVPKSLQASHEQLLNLITAGFFLSIVHTQLLEFFCFSGLGIHRIISAMMKAFCHPASLVLVINASGYEEEYLIERMIEDGVEQRPQIISSEISRDERWESFPYINELMSPD